jgi:hypothetical protein
MNCLEFRHLILTDPYAKLRESEAHLETCAQCTRFQQEILDLDSDIEKALSVEVPEGLASRILLTQSLKKKPTRPWVQYAMAASVFAALLFGVTFLTNETSVPNHGSTLMIANAAHQPHEFYGSEHQPIPQENVALLLARLNLTASIDNVVYAAVCPVGDESAAHLVIKDGDDQYTVMLLPDQSPSKMYTVNDQLWRGYISPHPAGALAVLAEAQDANAIARIREVTDKLQTAIYLSAKL